MQSVQQAVLQVMNNPLHLFAAASNVVLLLWDTVADLTPVAQLLPAGSMLLDSAVPAASLAMTLARAYWECLLHVSTFATTRVALPTGVEPG
jgi:hypothetical protein